jgi:Ca2+-binding RTX toxin-like protein
MATIWGNDSGNTLNGTAFADVIYGRSGDDAIQGLGGNDVIYGEWGNDRLVGGAGRDTLDGGAGNDWLGDPYSGDDGDDRMVGGAGFDQINGGAGNDNLDGGADNDTIKGGTGNDTMAGGSGDDWLIDTLRDNGADVFDPGTGNDHMKSYFDGMSDLFIMRKAAGGFGDDDIAYFEKGIDRIEFRGYTAADATVTTSGNSTTFTFSDGSSLLVDATGLSAGHDYLFV